MGIGSIPAFAAPSSAMLAQPKPAIEVRTPKPIDREALRAAWEAANPKLSPQQALASGAELGPPTDDPRADNHGSKIHTEIKVNGKVVARVYNSGGMEIANEYRFIADEMDFGGDRMVGPDLAKDRAQRMMAVLERYGAVIGNDASPDKLLSAKLARQPIVEAVMAATAQSQEQWLADKAKEGPLDPGMLFSRVA